MDVCKRVRTRTYHQLIQGRVIGKLTCSLGALQEICERVQRTTDMARDYCTHSSMFSYSGYPSVRGRGSPRCQGTESSVAVVLQQRNINGGRATIKILSDHAPTHRFPAGVVTLGFEVAPLLSAFIRCCLFVLHLFRPSSARDAMT